MNESQGLEVFFLGDRKCGLRSLISTNHCQEVGDNLGFLALVHLDSFALKLGDCIVRDIDGSLHNKLPSFHHGLGLLPHEHRLSNFRSVGQVRHVECDDSDTSVGKTLLQGALKLSPERSGLGLQRVATLVVLVWILGDDLLERCQSSRVDILVHVFDAQSGGLDALDLPEDDAAHYDWVTLKIEKLHSRQIGRALLDRDHFELDTARVEEEETRRLNDLGEFSPGQDQGGLLLVKRPAATEPDPWAQATQEAGETCRAAQVHFSFRRIVSYLYVGSNGFCTIDNLRQKFFFLFLKKDRVTLLVN